MGPYRYHEEEEPSFRRHSTRGHGYPLSHDRDLPPAPHHISYDSRRGFHSALHESRNIDNSSDQDSGTRTRSRIPVACGRCRKRKIRCSGDNGNGGPCSNCKSSGHDECTFLRVSSTPATLKMDNPIPEYYDNAAASRLQCRMVSQGPPQYMTTHSPSTINYDSYQYRNNNMSSYQQYPGKQYYSGISPFAEYEENVDYGLQTSPYQLMTPDQLQTSSSLSNYGGSGNLRGWTPAPQMPKSNSLFIEQEQPIYGHGQLPYSNAGNFPMRTSIGPEPKVMGLSAAPVLPTPISGNDRILPNPTANRPAQMNAFLLRNSDGMVPMAQQTYQPFANYMPGNMLSNLKTSNHNTVSDNSYMPMSSTSPESIASSHIYTESENSVSLGHHQSEIYSSNDGLHYHTSEPSESSYGHSNSSRRESHSSRTTQHENSLPSNPEGELSNGHHYVPYQHISANYPTPPMNIPPPAAIHSRSSVESVQR